MRRLGLKAVVVGAVAACLVHQSARAESDAARDMWSGPYLGLAVGGGYGKAESTTKGFGDAYFNAQDLDQFSSALRHRTGDGGSFLGTVLAGYSRRSGDLVYGIEADASILKFSERTSTGQVAYRSLPSAAFDMENQVETRFMASVRPRVGYVFGDTLAHASIGPAIGRFKVSSHFSDDNIPSESAFSKTRFAPGVATGLGLEYAVDRNWRLRADYRFAYFPDVVDGRSRLSNAPTDGFKYDGNFVMHAVSVGLAYQF